MSGHVPTQVMPPAIEAEADNGDANSTISVTSKIYAYRKENGRTYHAYNDGKYLAPNDEQEMDRMDLQHHLITLTLGGKLMLAPIPKEQTLHRVLDVGTGTGIWAIDFVDEHLESQVLGADLSPIQPGMVPPNLRFEIDDLELSWEYHNKFDLIYCRMMNGSFADWPRFFSQAYENLVPGGWIEVGDPSFQACCDDGSMDPNGAFSRWIQQILEGTRKVGRDCDAAEKHKARMEAAGFENVTEVMFKWPTNPWPSDKHMKMLGMWQHESLGSGLEAFSLAIYTRILGWSVEDLTVFLADVRSEMRDPKIHSYLPYYVVYGQKPKTAAV